MATKKPTSTTRTRTKAELAALAKIANTDFQPLMTRDAVFEAEAEYNTTWGVNRRVALMTITRTRAQLIEAAKECGIETVMEMAEQVSDWREHLKAGIEIADAATARLLATVVLAGEAGHV